MLDKNTKHASLGYRKKNNFIDTGLLIHGRHLQAVGWKKMMWGDPSKNILGSLPMAILVILNEGPERFGLITTGTGASSKMDGTTESEATKYFFIRKFDDLEEFARIKNHPRWAADKLLIKKLVNNTINDNVSQNTIEEVANAAVLFRKNRIRRVMEITGASHAPRCELIQSTARARGLIPPSQVWLLIADDVPYSHSKVSDTLVFEEPHRGDDPARDWPRNLRPPDVFREYLNIPPRKRLAFLREVSRLADDIQERE